MIQFKAWRSKGLFFFWNVCILESIFPLSVQILKSLQTFGAKLQFLGAELQAMGAFQTLGAQLQTLGLPTTRNITINFYI